MTKEEILIAGNDHGSFKLDSHMGHKMLFTHTPTGKVLYVTVSESGTTFRGPGFTFAGAKPASGFRDAHELWTRNR